MWHQRSLFQPITQSLGVGILVHLFDELCNAIHVSPAGTSVALAQAWHWFKLNPRMVGMRSSGINGPPQ